VKPCLTPRDFEGYVGIPWQDGGRTRAGADCWGLFRLVYAELLGIPLPSYDGAYGSALDKIIIKRLIEGRPDYWVRVADPVPGDGALINMGSRPHIGVVVGAGRMLHTERFGAVIESYDGLRFSTQLEGFYRYHETP
jgi:cell wall-associated NlpC family hydrolase